jgi:predicted hotdog family 3-hydroxylacyl-ACP dehydratase
MNDRPSIDALLPQGAAARLVEALVEEHADGVTCAGRMPARAPFARDGCVPGFFALELAAQAAAVFEGLRRWRQGAGAQPVGGYLVGLSDVVIECLELRAGVELTARVRQAGLAGPLARYEVSVTQGSTPCARGTISTLLSPCAEAPRGS